ncbi:MAG: hypothetical protein ABR600_04805 [Actinomycetota bacterium]
MRLTRMDRIARRGMLVAALAAVVLSAIPAGASATATTISGLATSVSGSTVTVTGQAAFGGQDAVLLGEDAANDNIGGANSAPYGTDLTGASISQPTPDAQNLVFTIKLSGLTAGGIPETVGYNWDFAVDGGANGGGADWRITTMRTRALVTQNANPYAATFTCVPGTGGTSSCTQVQLLSAVYDEAGKEIRVTVPFAAIGVSPGSVIAGRTTTPLGIAGTAFGRVSVTNLFDTMASVDDYQVPLKSVRLGIAPSGTPDDAVSFSADASVGSNGAFSGTLQAPGSGSYDVFARACFGTNCQVAKVATTV